MNKKQLSDEDLSLLQKSLNEAIEKESQVSIARRAGVSEAQLSRLLIQGRGVGAETACKLFNVLGLHSKADAIARGRGVVLKQKTETDSGGTLSPEAIDDVFRGLQLQLTTAMRTVFLGKIEAKSDAAIAKEVPCNPKEVAAMAEVSLLIMQRLLASHRNK